MTGADWGLPKIGVFHGVTLHSYWPMIRSEPVSYRLPEAKTPDVPGAYYIYGRTGWTVMVEHGGVMMYTGLITTEKNPGSRWVLVSPENAPERDHRWFVEVDWRKAKKLRRKGLA